MCPLIDQISLEPDPVALQVLLRICMDVYPLLRIGFLLLPEQVINRKSCLAEDGQTGQHKQKDDREFSPHQSVSMMSFRRPPAVWRVPAPAPWMSIGEG